MHSDMAVSLMADLFWTGLTVATPVLGLVMFVGVAISVLQVVTQVQELTLTFVPKLLTAALTLVAFGPWMLRRLVQFCTKLWTAIPGMF